MTIIKAQKICFVMLFVFNCFGLQLANQEEPENDNLVRFAPPTNWNAQTKPTEIPKEKKLELLKEVLNKLTNCPEENTFEACVLEVLMIDVVTDLFKDILHLSKHGQIALRNMGVNSFADETVFEIEFSKQLTDAHVVMNDKHYQCKCVEKRNSRNCRCRYMRDSDKRIILRMPDLY